eukprot:CAMPEP_0115625650 /NCGR_PEP_ID=MMETSP0272-20121206/27926_1 /TAXON_ID=71861 /ORGANISM="Scrippsiella trochoidea, Strain CCMP3099" /LENGTH=99 /DNA_ID=CAMNT_0003061957 /DNA_START=94 /DNA_END=391 /DNA_ORIENTATION=+
MSAVATSLIRRSAARMLAQVPKPQVSAPTGGVRGFATTKAASPETPLLHYTATQQATSSINHRIFYVNVIAMVFVVDEAPQSWTSELVPAVRPFSHGFC